jgi:hypothetical protein
MIDATLRWLLREKLAKEKSALPAPASKKTAPKKEKR